MKAQFIIRKSKAGLPYFEMLNDGELVGRSEEYKAKTSCKNGIKSIGKNGAKAEIIGVGQEGKNPRFQIFADRAKKIRFNLTATNGEIIFASSVLADEATAKKQIAWIKKNAAAAKVVDESLPAKKPVAKKPAAKKPAAKKAPAMKKAANAM